jgi:hypothetical protein
MPDSTLPAGAENPGDEVGSDRVIVVYARRRYGPVLWAGSRLAERGRQVPEASGVSLH